MTGFENVKCSMTCLFAITNETRKHVNLIRRDVFVSEIYFSLDRSLQIKQFKKFSIARRNNYQKFTSAQLIQTLLKLYISKLQI